MCVASYGVMPQTYIRAGPSVGVQLASRAGASCRRRVPPVRARPREGSRPGDGSGATG